MLPIKKLLIALVLGACMPSLALAANEKIDPENYLCAELISEPVIMKGEPPLFQILQLDGYVSSEVGMDSASADTVNVMLPSVFAWCQGRPTEKVKTVWHQLRSTGPVPDSVWHAKTTTCKDYALNPDDGSGFIIWLDGYNRAETKSEKSVLGSDQDIQDFIGACKAKPSSTMLEVLKSKAK